VTPAAALAWVKEHWRLVAIAAGLLVAFLAGRASRPQPTITAKQTEQVHQQAAEQHQAQQTTTERQATQAATSEHVDEQLHAHVHQVERVAPSGAKKITTDITYDDDLHVDEAQQVNVDIHFGSVLNLQEASSSSSDVHRESTVTQTPAPDRPIEVDLLAGISTAGPIYGARAAWSPGSLPLVHLPVWLGVQVQVAGGSPAVIGSVGAQL
jgi:membrane-bound lytic murein transglycosylase